MQMATKPTACTSDAYAIVIADLKRQRDNLDRMIRQLEAMAADKPAAPMAIGAGTEAEDSEAGARARRKSPSGGKGAFTGMKVAEAARILLSRHGGAMSPADIAARLAAGGLQIAGTNTVTSVLNRRRREVGDVVSPGRGLWALAGQETGEEPEGDTPEGGAPEKDMPEEAVTASESPLPGPVTAHVIAHDDSAHAETDFTDRPSDILAPRMPDRDKPAPPPWQPPVFNMESPAQE